MNELINHLKEADEQWRKDNAEYDHYCKGQVEYERTVEELLNQFDDFNNEAKVVEPFSDNYYKLKDWLSIALLPVRVNVNTDGCTICGSETETIFNIKLNAVKICESCARSITLQNIHGSSDGSIG